MAHLLSYLLVASGAFTVVLAVMVIYGNALDSREDEQIHVNKTEEKIMAGEQRALIGKMNRLARVITVFAVVTVVFWVAAAAVWAYIGLYRS